ncbi:adenosylmethionine decarboxylase [Nitratireductor rhodophyticola]|uniref:adenosylmethionine decarboxylase n=1 Tax=Nitratireductor rhodophyticola TaxID=2854036 RepID=UPI002AC94777|nr:adenosylmethionine decarboxylase [Nitratireductor rhodophyticola]WPZ13598.1 adenosylmethionine decarboxylase [Nitratireductor rhodophyticola]
MSQDALFQLGMDSVVLNTAQKEESITAQPESAACDDKDHFIEKDGVLCAGSHFIVDLFEAKRLDDLPYIQKTLIDCVNAAGATLLHIHLHPFEPNGGISGVAVLAESHISIHSWPERHYAALDIFMCGDAQPERCIDVLKEAFAPGRMDVNELLRGRNA